MYLSFAETGEGGKAGTAVGYGRLSDDGARLENFKVIFRQLPKLSVGNHFGGKLAFDRQGYLFIALGENNQRPTAQETDKLQGKLVRLTAEGAVPPDNPRSAGRQTAGSLVLRPPQSARAGDEPVERCDLGTRARPRGGDELNIPQPGKTTAGRWPPTASIIPASRSGGPGNGCPAPNSRCTIGGFRPASAAWRFMTGSASRPAALAVHRRAGAKELIRLTLEGDKVVAEERLLGDRGERIREVRSGPDGYLYLLTDERDGKLLKVGAS